MTQTVEGNTLYVKPITFDDLTFSVTSAAAHFVGHISQQWIGNSISIILLALFVPQFSVPRTVTMNTTARFIVTTIIPPNLRNIAMAALQQF